MVCTPADLTIALSGPTQALPTDAGGQASRLIATVMRSGAPAEGISVSLRIRSDPATDAGGSVVLITGSTNAAGQALIDYTPPASLLGESKIDQLAADCSSCTNSANMSIQVQGSPLVQGQSCDAGSSTPHPILPTTGIKVKTERDWVDAAPHPLTFTRKYASRWTGPPGAGMGNEWSHGFTARLHGGAATSRSRTVVYADGTSSTFTNLTPTMTVDVRSGGVWTCTASTFCVPSPIVEDPNLYPPDWQAWGNQDVMSEAAEGIVVRRATDDSTWIFDRQTGNLLRAQQRNGWTYSFTHSNGYLTAITNAFERRLLLAYDALGRLVNVTTPDGQSIGYSYDNPGRLSMVTLPDNSTKRYLYEDARWPSALTGINDEQGNGFERYAYDGLGRPISSELAGGADRYLVRYETRGSSITDPLGTTRSFRYVATTGPKMRGFRTEHANVPSDSGDAIANRTFTAEGLLASERDFLGLETLFTWDTAKILKISETRAAGRAEAQTVATQWHSSSRLPVLITEAGRTTAYTYDALGNKLGETITDLATSQARTWQWTYTSQGLVETMTDPKGAVWRYGYDNAGNRTSVRNPIGQKNGYAYDAAGRVTSQTDPNGLTTSYAYDVRGRLTQQVRGGEATSYSYTATGQLASAVMPNGYQVSYSYDAAQRLIAATDNRGATIQYTLDGAGNRVREEVKDASGVIALVTSRIIGSLNKVAAIQGSVGQTSALAYDANGEPVAHTDPLNQTTRQTLDGLRRPVATTFADNAAATQTWNQLGQRTGVTDPKGVATSYETNAFGEVMREISPDIGSMSYRRDAAGDVSGITDALGNHTTLERDVLGRPTTIQYASDHLASFSYDQGQAGYLAKIEDQGGAIEYQRDAQGRVLTKTQSVNDNPSNPSRFKVQYGYTAGELTSITYPSGLKVLYRRTAGRVTGIDVQEPSTNPMQSKPTVPFVGNLSHTALGQPRSWTWASGASASRSFDTDGRMTANEFASYSYDAASRITAITQNLWAEGTVTTGAGTATRLFTSPISWTAGYDMRNRLTGFIRAGAATRYTYDPNSNRLTAIDKVSSDADLDALFNADNFIQTSSQTLNIDAASNKLLGFSQSLTQVKGNKSATTNSQVNFAVDANGAMTSDGLRTFEYDASRRLSKVRILRNGEPASVNYLHNALGQRVFKSEPQAEQTLPSEEELGQGFVNWLRKQFGWLFTGQGRSKASIGIAFVYDEEGNLLGEYDNGSAAGKGRTEYLWLPTEDPSTGSGQATAVPIGIYRIGKFYAVHSDHLGTPRLITDEGAKPVWQWPYSAFGSNQTTGPLAASTSTTGQVTVKGTKTRVEVNLRYPGQYFDEESNLSYNYFRTYSPGSGRYTQPDPIGLDGGVNRFAYADGSPLASIDPLGLATYMCTQPLHALGTVGKWVYAPKRNPLYHQFIAIIDKRGGVATGGLDRAGKPWSKGVPSKEDGERGNHQCEMTEEDNDCIEKCLIQLFASARPNYALIPRTFNGGDNCQSWADNTLNQCRRQCKAKQ